jgi:putative hydrolase of the HAD superfamily
MHTIKAILFDYGGVLAEEGFSNGLEALAKEQALAVSDMTAEGMRAVYDSGFVVGRGGESEFWSLLKQRTGLRGDEASLRKRMFDGFVLRPWMLELVDALRKQGYVTGILSDQTDWLDRLDARDDFYRHFDRIYNSYAMGKGKRDQSHFSDVANALGLDPSAIAFIDDSRANVDRALAAGLQAIHYTDQDKLLKSIETLGIGLIPPTSNHG